MNYTSTRNSRESVSAARAIARGISPDGGLYIPQSFPHYDYARLSAWKDCTYMERAEQILADFLPEFTLDEIRDSVEAAYDGSKFPGPSPAPLSYQQNGSINMYVLELWHGPTCAFKDMALQLLPQLLTRSLKKIGAEETAVILVATSGDTGKAALEGFRDVPGTKVVVFYPEDGVSAMQKLQMSTQEGENVFVYAIHGNFDDAQAGVKRIFTDAALKAKLRENGMLLSSANSINWGRLLPQIVYYFSAYCDLMATGEMDYEGEMVNIVVPTGNFGNILAAYYAKKMGLPVHKLICASNSNNVLTEFLRTGIYDRNRRFFTTLSPSMDILISSNLERLLSDLVGNNSTRLAGWMDELAHTGKYQVDSETFAKIQELFFGGFCTDRQTQESIREIYQTENYVIDTHTAVAVNVYGQYIGETGDRDTPAILVSTASPYKFADSVLNVLADSTETVGTEFTQIHTLSALTGTPVPAPIEALETKPVRFAEACGAADMAHMVLRACGLNA